MRARGGGPRRVGPGATGCTGRAVRRCVGCCIAALLLLVSAGCAKELPPPAQSVQTLLKLRRERSVDTTAYARVIESTDLVKALVSDVTTANAGIPPIPRWGDPYVSSENSASASVVVVWKKDGNFPHWARATLFDVALKQGHWLVVDATELATQTPPAPLPAKK